MRAASIKNTWTSTATLSGELWNCLAIPTWPLGGIATLKFLALRKEATCDQSQPETHTLRDTGWTLIITSTLCLHIHNAKEHMPEFGPFSVGLWHRPHTHILIQLPLLNCFLYKRLRKPDFGQTAFCVTTVPHIMQCGPNSQNAICN